MLKLSSPEIFDISPYTLNHLVQKFDFPVISNISSIQIWASQVAKKDDIEKYVAYYYNIDNDFEHHAKEMKFVVTSIILTCLIEEENYLFYEQKVINDILQVDYHIHEGLVHWWADSKQGEEDIFSLGRQMRNLFIGRYLTKIEYTYEAPINLYSDCDNFKITCFEIDAKPFGTLTIHNQQQDISKDYHFEISQEQ